MGGSGRHIVLGVHITDRVKNVGRIQEILTEFGCYIKTRVGLHEASEDFCSPNGLILLEIMDNEEQHAGLVSALKGVSGVEVQEMLFKHD
jgi:hypothetical protein